MIPHRSTPFSSVAATIVSRLETRFERLANDGFVSLVVAPSPEFAPYRAEAGLHVVVMPPRPSDGGGKYDKKVSRSVVVYVYTQNSLDEAGSDRLACLAHLDAEDAVVDVMDRAVPVGTAVQIKWVPGGSSSQRLMKTDAGLVVSSLVFDVTYAQPFTVPE